MTARNEAECALAWDGPDTHICARPEGHDGRCVCVCGSWTDAPAVSNSGGKA